MPAASATVFPPGKPVDPEDLVDRLWDGQSVIIASPRRTGKSSVAQEALHRLQRRGACTATVDAFLASSQE